LLGRHSRPYLQELTGHLLAESVEGLDPLVLPLLIFGESIGVVLGNLI